MNRPGRFIQIHATSDANCFLKILCRTALHKTFGLTIMYLTIPIVYDVIDVKVAHLFLFIAEPYHLKLTESHSDSRWLGCLSAKSVGNKQCGNIKGTKKANALRKNECIYIHIYE